MRRQTRLWLLLALSFPAIAAAADDPLAVLEPVDADPLELARVVARLDSDAVLSALGEPAGVRRRLALIRAAPWIDGPHRALLPLAPYMAGRDSLLAPAAALSVARIVSDLDAATLSAEEVMPAELESARRAMASILAAEHVRPDIRAVAALAVGRCDDWFGPLPPPAAPEPK